MTDYLNPYIDLNQVANADMVDEMPYWASKFLDTWRSVLNPDDVQYVFIALEQATRVVSSRHKQNNKFRTVHKINLECVY